MTDRGSGPARPPSQTDVVVEGIKRMITSGDLAAGQRLPIEKDLADRLGVSRGSLREGVRALALLGVLESRQGDGTYVTSLEPMLLLSPMGFLAELHSEADGGDLLAIRRILEAESAARAASRLTEGDLVELGAKLDALELLLDAESPADLQAFIEADGEFHRAIAQAAGNPALAALIESLVSRTFRTRLWRAILERGTLRETLAEHRAILAELQRGDADGARLRMSVHLLGVEEFAHADRSAPDQ